MVQKKKWAMSSNTAQALWRGHLIPKMHSIPMRCGAETETPLRQTEMTSLHTDNKKNLSFSPCVGVRASLSRLRGCQSHFHWCTGASSLTEQASVGGTICRRSARFLYFLSAEMRAEQKFCALLNPTAASPAAHSVDIWRETRGFQRRLSEQQALSTANPPRHRWIKITFRIINWNVIMHFLSKMLCRTSQWLNKSTAKLQHGKELRYISTPGKNIHARNLKFKQHEHAATVKGRSLHWKLSFPL